MKTIILILISVLGLSFDCHARGKGGLGGGTRTVYKEKERVVYVLCDECRTHMPKISPPQGIPPFKISKTGYNWIQVEVPVENGHATMTFRSKDQLDSLTIEQNNKTVFVASYTGSEYKIDPEKERVSANVDEWHRLLQRLPIVVISN